MASIPRNSSADMSDAKSRNNPVPSPRASSVREAALKADPEKQKTRVDPQEAARQAAADAHAADPSQPAPQVGLSSSELNSAPPDVKAKATEEAKTLPHNNQGEVGKMAPSHDEAQKAQSQFAKEHGAPDPADEQKKADEAKK